MERKPELHHSFTRIEMHSVRENILDELGLKDSFQLNDRYEGKEFFLKKLRIYFVSKLILIHWGILTNRSDYSQVMGYRLIRKFNESGHKVFITDNILKVEESLKSFKIVGHFNMDSLAVKIYSEPGYLAQIKNEVLK